MALRDFLDDFRAWVNRTADARRDRQTMSAIDKQFCDITRERQLSYRSNQAAARDARLKLIQRRRRSL